LIKLIGEIRNRRTQQHLDRNVHLSLFCDWTGDNTDQFLRQIIISTAEVTIFAGNGDSNGRANGIAGMLQNSPPLETLVSLQMVHLLWFLLNFSFTGATSAGSSNGVGTNAQFNNPYECVSPDGSYALVIDSDNFLVRQIVISTASVITLAGSGISGKTDGIGTNARSHQTAASH
jgi:hypothetical protein